MTSPLKRTLRYTRCFVRYWIKERSDPRAISEDDFARVIGRTIVSDDNLFVGQSTAIAAPT